LENFSLCGGSSEEFLSLSLENSPLTWCYQDLKSFSLRAQRIFGGRAWRINVDFGAEELSHVYESPGLNKNP
jgi:hypothetical protein